MTKIINPGKIEISCGNRSRKRGMKTSQTPHSEKKTQKAVTNQNKIGFCCSGKYRKHLKSFVTMLSKVTVNLDQLQQCLETHFKVKTKWCQKW